MKVRQRRWPSEMRIVIERGEDAVPASVDDVSEGGLKIRSATLDARSGDRIVARAGKLRATGEVKWVRDRVFGLSFRPPLDADMLAYLTGGLYRKPHPAGAGRPSSRAGPHRQRMGHLQTM